METLYFIEQSVEQLDHLNVEPDMVGGLELAGLLHCGPGLVETRQQEVALGLGEEHVVVLGDHRQGLMAEGSQCVLEGPVLEEDLSGVFVNGWIVRPQGWLLQASLPMYSCRSRKASLPSPSICRQRDRSRKH